MYRLIKTTVPKSLPKRTQTERIFIGLSTSIIRLSSAFRLPERYLSSKIAVIVLLQASLTKDACREKFFSHFFHLTGKE